MRIDALTLFPAMFAPIMSEGMMRKASEQGLLEFHTWDIRDYAGNRHRKVDDAPYGGGGGMILKPDALVRAIDAVKADSDAPVILLSPQGRLLTHGVARALSREARLILVCGRYEGVDERVRQLVISDEISIGDYVLTGGELAALVLIDAVVRQIPGVLGAEGASENDSHANSLLEGPHYTRPAIFRGLGVPQVLTSGHHAEVERWRRNQALKRTWRLRPDLLAQAQLDEADRAFLAGLNERD